MKVSIMQPTFLPWVGYFSIIKSSDIFVLLDDVGYSRQSWQTRNRFYISGKVKWLSIPVKASLNTNINQVKIFNLNNFINKTKKSLIQSYSKSKNIEFIELLFEYIKKKEVKNLASFNTRSIIFCKNYLNIKCRMITSSSLSIDANKKEDKIIKILKNLKAEEYICATGSKEYMQNYGLDKFPCSVNFYNYKRAKSISGFEKFNENLSIVHSLLSYSVKRINEEI